MKELQTAIQTLVVIGVVAGGWSRFMEMIFDLARVIAKRIERKEVVLTDKEIEMLTTSKMQDDEAYKDFALRVAMNKRNIKWQSMSYNKANHKLYYWTNYST